jgi:hypothetical protein
MVQGDRSIATTHRLSTGSTVATALALTVLLGDANFNRFYWTLPIRQFRNPFSTLTF